MLASQPLRAMNQIILYCGAGLAEAGLIPSRFSSTSGELDEWGYDSDPEETNFSPDRFAAE